MTKINFVYLYIYIYHLSRGSRKDTCPFLSHSGTIHDQLRGSKQSSKGGFLNSQAALAKACRLVVSLRKGQPFMVKRPPDQATIQNWLSNIPRSASNLQHQRGRSGESCACYQTMLNHVKPLQFFTDLHSMLDQVWPNSENSLWFRDHRDHILHEWCVESGHAWILKGIQVDALHSDGLDGQSTQIIIRQVPGTDLQQCIIVHPRKKCWF